MLDIDYMGEVHNPDGLPGLYDQVPRMYTKELPECARQISLFAKVARYLESSHQSPDGERRGTW
eukprot:1449839-Pleurochrysis_carterae.AAC.1